MDDHAPRRDPRALLRPVETQRASEAIYDQIRELIISGDLRPGDRLPSERKMMEAFQRSRPTVREALRMLERADLIRTAPGTRGAVVQALDSTGVERPLRTLLKANKVSLRDLVEYRIQNESAVARWAAARRTREDLEALEEVLERADRLRRAGDYMAFIQCDLDFHGDLAKAGRNEVSHILSRVLCGLVDNLMHDIFSRQSREESASMCTRILEQHRRIYAAVYQGDADAAAQAMLAHIRSSGVDLDGI